MLKPQSLGNQDHDAGYQGIENRPWYLERWFLAAAIFLALVVALFVMTLSHSTKVHAPTGPVTASTATPSALPVVPTAAPAGTTWNLWYGIALPSLPGSPASNDGDVPNGFAHTPEGALIAASQLSYRIGFGTNWRSVADKYAIGANRDAFIAALADAPNHEDTSSVAQLAAFRFVSYATNQAVIELVNGTSPNYQTGTITLSWVDGDWRLLITPDKEVSTAPARLTNLAGYATWTGVAR